MAIIPDDKNWTWVLERACPECGFDASAFDPSATGAVILAIADEWTTILASADARRRPSDQQWSALEYGCHVRDVLRLYSQRLRLMLDVDDPTFENWDQDATAIADAYDQQDPAVVARELVEAAQELAKRFDSVADNDWQRTGTRSDGARFTIRSFAQYMIHDPIHHVYDAHQGFRLLGPTV